MSWRTDYTNAKSANKRLGDNNFLELEVANRRPKGAAAKEQCFVGWPSQATADQRPQFLLRRLQAAGLGAEMWQISDIFGYRKIMQNRSSYPACPSCFSNTAGYELNENMQVVNASGEPWRRPRRCSLKSPSWSPGDMKKFSANRFWDWLWPKQSS